MKLFSKFLAMIIALSLSLSLISPALAAYSYTESDAYPVNTTDMVVEQHENYVLVLRGEDLSNGDARFSMIENGQVISCSYVNRSEGKTVYTQYKNGTELFSEEKAVQQISQDQPTQSQPGVGLAPHSVVPVSSNSGYTYVGKVGYNYYFQGWKSTNYIDWAYSTSFNPNSCCDLHGSYRDVADFAAYILSVIGLFHAHIAIQIASAVFAVLGINGSPTQFLIPPYIVDCTETTVIWRASIGSDSQFYKGHHYVVTHPDGTTQTLTDGENGALYYPTTAIAHHNTTLALTPCSHFFRGADSVEIISWPS